MRQTNIKVASVVGNPTDTRWSQVHSDITNSNRLMFVAVDIKGAELMDLPMYGGEVIEQICSEYITSDLDGLKDVIGKSISNLMDDISISVAVLCIVGDVVYVAGLGNVKLVLYREGELYSIFEGESEISGLSGEIRKEDKFILGTEDFFAVTENSLIGALGDGVAVEEILAPMLHNEENSSSMAGIVLGYVGGEGSSKVHNLVSSSDAAEKPRKKRNGIFGGVKKATKDMDLRIKRDKNGKKSTYLGIIVLSLLVISVAVGAWRRSSMLKERKYSQLEQQINQQMAEVTSIADLNPERAKYLLSQARGEVNTYLGEKSNIYEERAQELLNLINQTETQAMRRSEATVEPYLDFSVVREGSNMGGFYMDQDGNLYMFDSNSGEVYALNLEDKSSIKIGSSDDFPELIDLSYYDDGVFGVTSDGVVSKTPKGDRQVVVEKDDDWKDIKFIDMYAGNIYLMDAATGEIWKYPVLDDGWGARRRWFGTGIVLDLSNVIDFAVDGDIWLLTGSGKLERYSLGVPAEFSMEGFGERFSQPKGMYVGEDYVYVLEAGEGRVVVFNKSGKYEKQYVGEAFSGAKGIVVNGKVGYVLTGTKVFRFEID